VNCKAFIRKRLGLIRKAAQEFVQEIRLTDSLIHGISNRGPPPCVCVGLYVYFHVQKGMKIQCPPCFNNQLIAQFLYSITICMLHYNPRHVSSINMPIFRRTNCIITASGIVTLCKRLYSMPEESRLQSRALIRHTVQPFTESDDIRYCGNTICPPEDWHVNARNISRIIM
jgi:hypothetical protein